MGTRLQLLTAARVLPEGGRLLDGGGVLVDGGRIREVLEDAAAVRRRRGERGVQSVDLGEGLLAPGLVNAHAHLELGWAHGRIPAGGGFAGWVGALVRARRDLAPGAEAAALADGLGRCLETGTTTVADVDASDAYDRLFPVQTAEPSGGVAAAPESRPWPLVLRLREVLDAGDPARSEAAYARVRTAPSRRPGLLEGLSPHAPFTVGLPLLRRCAQLARARSLPIQVHWAESAEERAWLLRGQGPFAAILGASPRTGGLDLLDAAGLLGPGLSLVHANHPEGPDDPGGDVARVAAAGAGVVHCPGSHAFFGRAPFDWRRWLRAGVPIGLGTDSLASNDDLDLGRELALAAAAPGAPSPGDLWEAATAGGARVLGLGGEVGRLAPGLRADLVLFTGLPSVAGPGARKALLEGLTAGAACARTVIVGGVPVGRPAP